jgi:hypothetical protein
LGNQDTEDLEEVSSTSARESSYVLTFLQI